MKIRRILSFFVATTILVTALMGTMTVLAETPEWDLGDGGIKATLDDNGVFTVTGKGAMPEYTSAGDTCPYNDEKSEITSIVISSDNDSDIKSIGNFNFSNCTSLKSADIADTVTSIGASAFFGCTNATIDIKGTLEKDNIGTSAFGTSGSYVKKIIVHSQETLDAVRSKTGNGKADVELQADAGSLKKELQDLINTTKETHKQEDYTADTYKTLSEALTKADNLVSQASPSTEEIQNAMKAINDAIGKLVTVVEGLKKELQTAITDAGKIVTTTYTTSSVAALNKAIEDAKTAITKSEVTKDELTKAKTALEAASKVDETGLAETGLKVKASIEDLQRIDNAISNAKQSGEGYTEESYARYRKVVDKLLELNGKTDDITDAQIDAVIAELEEAEKQLVLDFTDFEKIRAKAEVYLLDEFIKSNYTDDSISTLNGAVDIAEEKLKMATTPQDVKTEIDKIKKAIESLEKKQIEPQTINNPQPSSNTPISTTAQPTINGPQPTEDKIIKNRKGIKVKSKKRKITIKLNRKKKCKYLIKIFNNKNKNIAKNPVTQGSTSKKLVTTYKKIKKGKYLVQIYEVKANKAMNKISNVQCIYADYKKVK